MRRFVNAANAITSCGLGAGFIAIVLAGHGRLRAAAVAVAVAVVLDAVDGCVARRALTCGTFGCELDSLADLVAFGVAPALMMHKVMLHALPILDTGVCVIFVIAGAWRLARFAVMHDDECFVGLPIPVAGIIAAVAAAAALGAVATLALCVALALLMVSSIRFPNLVTLGRLVRRRPQRLPHPPPLRSRHPRRAIRPTRASRPRARRPRLRAPR